MTVPALLNEIGDTYITLMVPLENTKFIIDQQMVNFMVTIDDGRHISSRQRRKIFALVKNLVDFISAPPESARKQAETEMLREMHLLYLIDKSDSEAVRAQLTYHFCELRDSDIFSLSDVDMTTASDFIDYLVTAFIRYDVPCNETLLNLAEDIGRYTYSTLCHKKCAVCGKPGELHHVDHVGMGRERHQINHIGLRAECLCRIHHEEVHRIGQQTFDESYHLESIVIDENICRIWSLNNAQQI